MSAPKKNQNSKFSCFSTIFKRLICNTNLPTYPDHDDRDHDHQITPHKSLNPKIDPTQININPNNDTQMVEFKPRIVARLMGLDPNSIPVKTAQNDDSLFLRSKSLNSLNFFPDFNSNKSSVFHHRSASTSSLRFKIDEEIDSFKEKQGRREKTEEPNLKEKSREKLRVLSNKRFEEGYSTKKRKKNEIKGLNRDQKCRVLMQNKGRLGVNNNQKRVYNNQKKKENVNRNKFDHQVSSDSMSRSPVSVLDHHHHHLVLMDHSPSKEDERQSSRRKPARPIKKENDEQKSAQKQVYFLEFLGQIWRLAEEQLLKDPKWVANFNVDFEEKLCFDLGAQILDFMLNELIEELIYH